MKTSADLRGCYPLRPSSSVHNILLDLQNSSYPPQPHLIIANYLTHPFYVVGVFFSTLLVLFILVVRTKSLWTNVCLKRPLNIV